MLTSLHTQSRCCFYIARKKLVAEHDLLSIQRKSPFQCLHPRGICLNQINLPRSIDKSQSKISLADTGIHEDIAFFDRISLTQIKVWRTSSLLSQNIRNILQPLLVGKHRLFGKIHSFLFKKNIRPTFRIAVYLLQRIPGRELSIYTEPSVCFAVTIITSKSPISFGNMTGMPSIL